MENIKNHMSKIEKEQKKIPLLSKTIEGFYSVQQLIDLELSDPDNTSNSFINVMLDYKSSVANAIPVYIGLLKKSEKFLIENNVDIDFSWISMTKKEWEIYHEQEKQKLSITKEESSKGFSPLLKKKNR